MKKKTLLKVFLVLIIFTVFSATPIHSFANSKIVKNNIPPINQISVDPNYSTGYIMLLNSTVGGGCNISKLSSSSVKISGNTTCSPASPAVTITLKLQAYYNGDWQTLASKSKTQSGTSVSLSQTYTVTSGYYYRVYATHSVADGSRTYSYSNSILIN